MPREQPFELDPAAWAGIVATAQAPPAPPEEPPAKAPPPRDWQRALLAESRVGQPPAAADGPAPPPGLDALPPPSMPPGAVAPTLDPRTVKARPAPLSPGDRLRLPPMPREDRPPPGARGWSPGQPTRDPAHYEALMDWVYRAPLQGLLAAMATEPLFRYAAGRWRQTTVPREVPAVQAANQALLEVVYDRISALMGGYFDFDPAPIVRVHQDRPGWTGAYLPRYDALAIANRMLADTFAELVDTIAHEQIHALQWQRMRTRGAGRDAYERSLVARWSLEMPQIERIPYRARAIEVHAFWVGGAVGAPWLQRG